MTISLKLSKKAQEVFNTAIQNELASLESLRLRKLEEYNTRKKIIFTIGLPIILVVSYIEHLVNDSNAFAFIVMTFLLGSMLYIIKPKKQFKSFYLNIFKDKFVKSFFKQLFDYTYEDSADSMEEKLRGYQLLKGFNRYKGEDYFYGIVDNDIKLEFAEVDVSLRNGNEEYHGFAGGVVLLTMPFSFNSHTVVNSKALKSNVKNIYKDLDKIKTDKPILSKYFTVMSNDKHRAFQLLSSSFTKILTDTSVRLHELFNEEFSALSPDFEQRIEGNKKEGIDDEMNTATLEIEVKDNKVLILIRGQYDFLAPADLKTSVYCTQRLAVIEQQMELIANLARQLKLDYLKERKMAVNKSTQTKND